ncbi:ferrochelatase, mitochondrial isoform X1 [Malaya genurostris]|uniref:ferrochelatase, mitochondrial isoform X1 n=2 Tax=Malaya genurostris TaxID=325434 RepID=UPI0026F407E5|nr:ferrochelatase, mitochondrial isoform X1 [Malaya genurostris]
MLRYRFLSKVVLAGTSPHLRCFGTQTVKPRTAIVMLNMGGPQNTDQVHDYLHRIMTDRDMIQLPVQSKLGPWIAKRRTPEVQKKYSEIGGGSPILKWTNLQGELLCQQLDKASPETAPHKHYVAFRYVTPLTEDALQQVERDQPERVVLFSQYPQYSCATSGSSFNAIFSHYKNNKNGLSKAKWSIIDRWGTHPLLAKTFADNIRTELNKFPKEKQKDVILLFSAHSLPLKAVNRGDAYPSEVGATVQNVMDELKYCNPYCLVWQSKVGPLPWLEPFTENAIKGYVKQGKKNFILIPIAFVNEHIETLHELDIEYCTELAHEVGAEKIGRAAAPNDHPLFIDALTDIVHSHLRHGSTVNPKFLLRCPACVNAKCSTSKEWFREICN